MPLGAGLLRLVGAECNIHAFADFLKLGNLGAGIFQFGIIAVPLCFEGVKTLPISAWEKEYTALKAQREAEYDTLKETRAEVAELQKIRKCVDIALRADQPEQTQSRTKRHDIDR